MMPSEPAVRFRFGSVHLPAPLMLSSLLSFRPGGLVRWVHQSPPILLSCYALLEVTRVYYTRSFWLPRQKNGYGGVAYGKPFGISWPQ